MIRSLSAGLVLAAAGLAVALPAARSESGAGGAELRSADSFAKIADRGERSAALFTEVGRVLLHPRCVNCHPAGDSPLQGEDGRSHEPPAVRGSGGLGVVGMRCRTCHQRENFDAARVPGARRWLLAPRKMAWEGLSVAEICEQLKDNERNGGKTLKDIVEHMDEDHLVGWAWSPGAGRQPPPGTQEEFGDLVRAWVKTGAACPAD